VPEKTLNGNQALAQGALEAGVKVVASYPGSPASGVVEELISLATPTQVYLEWSANEKVSLEVGIGASLAGSRALVCVKSVGMNALIDPLMVVNLTGVHAGLVILLGDDPGAYGSQNDQDTRPIATFAELPLLEPSTPEEGKAMLMEAFELSERYQTLVIVRETRSFSQSTGAVEVVPAPRSRPALPMNRERYRWVPYPRNAVEKHRELHQKLERLREWMNTSRFNAREGDGPKGILSAGFAYRKLLDVLGVERSGLRLLKLGTIYPAPDRVIGDFLEGCEEALVLEENEPYLETQVKAIAHERGCKTRILGKHSGHVSWEGELFRWQIQKALEFFAEGWVPARRYTQAEEAAERPHRLDYCVGCRYPETLEVLKDAGRELGQDPVLVGDPGCLAKASHILDAKYAMGSAVGVAQGMIRAGLRERAVAIFGDSSFFHFALPSLISAVYNQTPILMLVLDNSATVTSGFQPNPGSGKSIRGERAPKLSVEGISKACGVDFVRTIGPDAGEEELRKVFREGLKLDGLGLIVIRKPCERPVGS